MKDQLSTIIKDQVSLARGEGYTFQFPCRWCSGRSGWLPDWLRSSAYLDLLPEDVVGILFFKHWSEYSTEAKFAQLIIWIDSWGAEGPVFKYKLTI